MGIVKVDIDGHQVTGHEGMTILEAAKLADIYIPVLCHSEELSFEGKSVRTVRLCTRCIRTGKYLKAA